MLNAEGCPIPPRNVVPLRRRKRGKAAKEQATARLIACVTPAEAEAFKTATKHRGVSVSRTLSELVVSWLTLRGEYPNNPDNAA